MQGWAASRGLPPPLAHRDGWRVEVGLPLQRRRHVFPGISPALRALGESIVEPWSYLKACATADQLRAAVPAHWRVEPQTYFMRFDGPPLPAPALPDGYRLDATLHAGGRILACKHGAHADDQWRSSDSFASRRALAAAA